MNFDEILNRAVSNGTNCAVARKERDEGRAQFNQRDTDRLCNLYPEMARDIRLAFEDAYKSEYRGQ